MMGGDEEIIAAWAVLSVLVSIAAWLAIRLLPA